MNEKFNEKSQDKKGHRATYTCPSNTRTLYTYTLQLQDVNIDNYENIHLNQHGPAVI